MIISGFAPLNTQNCHLNESRIDLWQFSLKHELNVAYQLLHPDERARGERFYFSHHKRRFTTARATLRIILGRYLNMAPNRLEFSYNEHGKPHVHNTQKLHFNLSHSKDLAILAVGKNFPLGVDIEYYSARPYEGMARNSFSKQELECLSKAPPSFKATLFFHIWSQKEAFIKATGLGLAYPTSEFSVPTIIPSKQLIEDPLHDTTWLIRSFMPQIACSGALCYHPTIREIRYGVVQLNQSSLIRI